MVKNLINGMKLNSLLFSMILWLRGLLVDNRIPDTLFYKLKTYVPELSKNIPDIEAVNNQLMNDIKHLNSKEEFEYVKKVSSVNSMHSKKTKVRKYNSIRIVDYFDIIEFCGIMDRVLVIDIDMDDTDDFHNYCKEYAKRLQKTFYYTIRLSTLNKN